MKFYNAKVDSNQREITLKLRKLGVSVKPVHQVKGFVDLALGYKGLNYLIELKDPNKPPSQKKLTDDEQKFQDGWLGSVHTC